MACSATMGLIKVRKGFGECARAPLPHHDTGRTSNIKDMSRKLQRNSQSLSGNEPAWVG